MRSSDSVLGKTTVTDSEVVGHVASFDRDGEHEVTCWLGKEYWRRGSATEALKAFLHEDTARPVFGRVVKDSEASGRALEKCGFSVCAEDKGFAAGGGVEVEEFVLRLDRSGEGTRRLFGFLRVGLGRSADPRP